MVSGALGSLAQVVPPVRDGGATVLAMVATVQGARDAVAAGADGIIAQGAEAGGQRAEIVADGSLRRSSERSR